MKEMGCSGNESGHDGKSSVWEEPGACSGHVDGAMRGERTFLLELVEDVLISEVAARFVARH